MKGKLRHIAISVPDKEKAAKFYQDTFGCERVSQSRVATRQFRDPNGIVFDISTHGWGGAKG